MPLGKNPDRTKSQRPTPGLAAFAALAAALSAGQAKADLGEHVRVSKSDGVQIYGGQSTAERTVTLNISPSLDALRASDIRNSGLVQELCTLDPAITGQAIDLPLTEVSLPDDPGTTGRVDPVNMPYGAYNPVGFGQSTGVNGVEYYWPGTVRFDDTRPTGTDINQNGIQDGFDAANLNPSDANPSEVVTPTGGVTIDNARAGENCDVLPAPRVLSAATDDFRLSPTGTDGYPTSTIFRVRLEFRAGYTLRVTTTTGEVGITGSGERSIQKSSSRPVEVEFEVIAIGTTGDTLRVEYLDSAGVPAPDTDPPIDVPVALWD